MGGVGYLKRRQRRPSDEGGIESGETASAHLDVVTNIGTTVADVSKWEKRGEDEGFLSGLTAPPFLTVRTHP
jgi:hypothetical protein